MTKIKFRILGIKDVNWEEYDFYVLPTLTYSIRNMQEGFARVISLEWGHWTICILLLKIKHYDQRN